ELWWPVGMGDPKLRAKLAGGFAKPRGVFRLTQETWDEVMGGRPTKDLWGIGSKTAAKLASIGIETVSDLADADEQMLASTFGPRIGPWLRRLGAGEGGSEVGS